MSIRKVGKIASEKVGGGAKDGADRIRQTMRNVARDTAGKVELQRAAVSAANKVADRVRRANDTPATQAGRDMKRSYEKYAETYPKNGKASSTPRVSAPTAKTASASKPKMATSRTANVAQSSSVRPYTSSNPTSRNMQKMTDLSALAPAKAKTGTAKKTKR